MDGKKVRTFNGFVGTPHVSGATILKHTMISSAPKPSSKKRSSSSSKKRSSSSKRKSKRKGERSTIVSPELIILTDERVVKTPKPQANRLIIAAIKELRHAYIQHLEMKRRSVPDDLCAKINFQMNALPVEIRTDRNIRWDDKNAPMNNPWYSLAAVHGFVGVDIEVRRYEGNLEKKIPNLYLLVQNGPVAKPKVCAFGWSVYKSIRYMNGSVNPTKFQRLQSLASRFPDGMLLSWQEFQDEGLTIEVPRRVDNSTKKVILPFADPKFLCRLFQQTNDEIHEYISGRASPLGNKRKRNQKKKKLQAVISASSSQIMVNPDTYAKGQLTDGDNQHCAPGELERKHTIYQGFTRPFGTYVHVDYDKEVILPTGKVSVSTMPMEQIITLQGRSLCNMISSTWKDKYPIVKLSMEGESLLDLPGIFSEESKSLCLSVCPNTYLLASSSRINEQAIPESKKPWAGYFEHFVGQT